MIKLAKPYIPEEAIEKASELIRSGNLVQGEYVRQLEDQLEKFLDVPYATVVSSGTAALHLSLIAAGIGPGDEVIIPAFTFPATANVVEIVGAKPVFADINPGDFCINTSLIKEKITEKTRAVMPVHEFGQAARLKDLTYLCKQHDLIMIEDAACALGTEFNNGKAGCFGRFGCFSLHPRKAITTGEGGVVVTHNKEDAKKIERLRNHGIDLQDGMIDFVTPGFNYRMTNFQAVLGVYQMMEIDKIIDHRIRQAKKYNELLQDEKLITCPENYPERKNVFQTYHIILENSIDRDKLKNDLKDKGIETNLGAQALHCLSYYKNKYQFHNDDFPVAYNAYTQGLALPLGFHVSEQDQKYIVETIKRLLI